MHAGPYEGAAGPLAETITLRQAKKLIQCMAAEQSFLLLSPPGVGKSDMVYQAAREMALPCQPGETAILKVTVVKPLAQYQGSTQNGVTSHDFGPFGTAYRLAAI